MRLILLAALCASIQSPDPGRSDHSTRPRSASTSTSNGNTIWVHKGTDDRQTYDEVDLPDVIRVRIDQQSACVWVLAADLAEVGCLEGASSRRFLNTVNASSAWIEVSAALPGEGPRPPPGRFLLKKSAIHHAEYVANDGYNSGNPTLKFFTGSTKAVYLGKLTDTAEIANARAALALGRFP